jgi:hypothetical protein
LDLERMGRGTVQSSGIPSRLFGHQMASYPWTSPSYETKD